MTDSADEDQLDLQLLQRHLQLDASSSAGSTILSDADVWPLRLSTELVDNYILGDVIGTGSYATVKECIDTTTLERCAVKIVNKRHLLRQNPKALANQLQEIRILTRLNHENLISMQKCLMKDTKIYIILEFCTFQMSSLLAEQSDGKFPVATARNLFHQLMRGLDYLHSLGIVHRDIKPQNLLIKTCGTLKIIDLGVAKILPVWSQEDTCTEHEGSPLFQAPELIAGSSEYSGCKVDIWSAGVTLYLMVSGDYPFIDEGLLGLYDTVMGENFKELDQIESKPMINDLLNWMLEKCSHKRASSRDVLDHPWMSLLSTPLDSNCYSQHPANGGDMYRSMSVLPYLYSHHFPDLPIANKQSPSAGSMSSTASPNSADSTILGTIHEILEEQPTMWGTEQQYNLLRKPQVRANRIKMRR